MYYVGDIYYWRQVIVLSSTLAMTISTAFITSFPSVFDPALLSDNNTGINATLSETSNIASYPVLGSIIGFTTYPIILVFYSRKTLYKIININVIIGWVIISLAPNVTVLLIGRIYQGQLMAAQVLQLYMISEYCCSTRRGYFVSLLKLSHLVGSMACHSSVLILTWRQVASYIILCNIYSLVVCFLFPESPSHLAAKNRIPECVKAFEWLHGNGNKEELLAMIATRKADLTNNIDKSKVQTKKKFMNFLKILFESNFRKSVLIVVCITMIIEASGKHYMMVYVIRIMTMMFEDSSVAVYVSLGSDALAIIAAALSCIFIKLFPRKVLLFSFGGLDVFLLLMISLSEYLKLEYVVCIQWLTPLLILTLSFVVNLSIIPICSVLLGEVFSLNHRNVGTVVASMILTVGYGVTMKIFPCLTESIGIIGVNIICGVIVFVNLVVLYFVLPETKDRTLMDIENEIKGNTGKNVNMPNPHRITRL